MAALELEIELGPESVPGQRWASIKAGGVTIFSSLVYDNRESPAERNILLMFGTRMRRLLEDDE